METPRFYAFDTNAKPTSLGIQWKKWLTRFQNYLVAVDVADVSCKKALMLYYGGKGRYILFVVR